MSSFNKAIDEVYERVVRSTPSYETRTRFNEDNDERSVVINTSLTHRSSGGSFWAGFLKGAFSMLPNV